MKLYNVWLERLKINRKEGGVGPLFLKRNQAGTKHTILLLVLADIKRLPDSFVRLLDGFGNDVVSIGH